MKLASLPLTRLAGLDQLLDRDRPLRPHGIERPRLSSLGHVESPVDKVARVDDLDRPVSWSGNEHLSAVGHSADPVTEAVRPVVVPDDEAGPEDECATRKGLLDLPLGERLQRPVGLVDVFGLFLQLLDGALLVVRAVLEGVDGAARDERVVPDRLGEGLGRGAHDARHVARGVEGGFPRPTLEGREIAVPVALEPLNLRKQIRVRSTAVEKRHLVPSLERGLDEVAADEQRAAEDEQPHLPWNSGVRFSTKAAMPSFWSSVEKSIAKSLSSTSRFDL